MEELMEAHILRLKKEIEGRDPNSLWDREQNKVDLKNLASLYEGRIPQYRDHGPELPAIEMFEFADLCTTV